MENQNLPAKPQIKITFPEELERQKREKLLAIGLYGVTQILKYFFPNKI